MLCAKHLNGLRLIYTIYGIKMNKLADRIEELSKENLLLRALLEYWYLSAARGSGRTNIEEFTKILYGNINKDTYKRLIKEIDFFYVR